MCDGVLPSLFYTFIGKSDCGTQDRGSGRFAGPAIFQAAFAFGVWKYFFSHFLCGQSIDRGQTKSAGARLISPYLFALFTCSTTDEFGHIIFTHQTQTRPEKWPALQTFPAHDQVYPWYLR